jgi:hypothetical protein
MFDVCTNEKLYSHQHHLLFIVLERPRGDVMLPSLWRWRQFLANGTGSCLSRAYSGHWSLAGKTAMTDDRGAATSGKAKQHHININNLQLSN